MNKISSSLYARTNTAVKTDICSWLSKWINIHTFLFTVLLGWNSSAKAQFIEAELCIGGEGQDLYMFNIATRDGGRLLAINTNSTSGDFESVSSNNYTIAFIKLNARNEIQWKTTYKDSLFSINGYQSTTCRVAEDDGVFIIDLLGDYNKILALDLNGNFTHTFSDQHIHLGFYGTKLFSIDTLNNEIYHASFTADTSLQLIKLNYTFDTIWLQTIPLQDEYRDIECNWTTSTHFAFDIAKTPNQIILNYLSSVICQQSIFPIILKNTSHSFLFNRTDGRMTRELDRPYISSDSYYDGPFLYSRGEDYFYNIVGGPQPNAVDLVYKYDLNTLTLLDSFTYRNGGVLYPTTFISTTTKYITTGLIDSDNVDSLALFVNNKFADGYSITLIDTVSTGFIKNCLTYGTSDSSILIFYQKNNEFRLSKVNAAFEVQFNKLLATDYGQEFELEYNTDYIGGNEFWRGTYSRVGFNEDNSVFTFFSFRGAGPTSQNYYQDIFKIDLSNGDIQYEFRNNNARNETYQYIKQREYGKIFCIRQLREDSRRCNLGNMDISFSTILLNANTISARAFIDYNNNLTKESGEPFYHLGYLQSEKKSRLLSIFLVSNRFTTNILDTGRWVTRIKPFSDLFTISPDSLITNHQETGYADSILFALYPNQTVRDLQITLVNSFITRLGQEAVYEITYANNGTHPASGMVKLKMDPRVHYQSSTPAVSAILGDTLSWNFNSLQAGGVSKIKVHVTADIPPDLDAGDTLQHYAYITPVTTDSLPGNNLSVLNELMLTSYDPNDKLTTSGKDLTPEQIENGEYITYVIRFQNTGNDTAFRVVLEDTLDNHLDWTTLQPAGASHPFTMQVNNGNIIHFIFYPIRLPHSGINEPQSHGYVAYKIKVKKDVPQGYTIKNRAHIYFDYNTPVTTATATTRIISLTSLSSNSKPSENIIVYPNPTSGVITIQLRSNARLENIQLTDIRGKVVYTAQPRSETYNMDTGKLPAGIYLLHGNSGGESFSVKVIIN